MQKVVNVKVVVRAHFQKEQPPAVNLVQQAPTQALQPLSVHHAKANQQIPTTHLVLLTLHLIPALGLAIPVSLNPVISVAQTVIVNLTANVALLKELKLVLLVIL